MTIGGHPVCLNERQYVAMSDMSRELDEVVRELNNKFGKAIEDPNQDGALLVLHMRCCLKETREIFNRATQGL